MCVLDDFNQRLAAASRVQPHTKPQTAQVVQQHPACRSYLYRLAPYGSEVHMVVDVRLRVRARARALHTQPPLLCCVSQIVRLRMLLRLRFWPLPVCHAPPPPLSCPSPSLGRHQKLFHGSMCCCVGDSVVRHCQASYQKGQTTTQECCPKHSSGKRWACSGVQGQVEQDQEISHRTVHWQPLERFLC